MCTKKNAKNVKMLIIILLTIVSPFPRAFNIFLYFTDTKKKDSSLYQWPDMVLP